MGKNPFLKHPTKVNEAMEMLSLKNRLNKHQLPEEGKDAEKCVPCSKKKGKDHKVAAKLIIPSL